jgi:hypothetical protein
MSRYFQVKSTPQLCVDCHINGLENNLKKVVQ